MSQEVYYGVKIPYSLQERKHDVIEQFAKLPKEEQLEFVRQTKNKFAAFLFLARHSTACQEAERKKEELRLSQFTKEELEVMEIFNESEKVFKDKSRKIYQVWQFSFKQIFSDCYVPCSRAGISDSLRIFVHNLIYYRAKIAANSGENDLVALELAHYFDKSDLDRLKWILKIYSKPNQNQSVRRKAVNLVSKKTLLDALLMFPSNYLKIK